MLLHVIFSIKFIKYRMITLKYLLQKQYQISANYFSTIIIAYYTPHTYLYFKNVINTLLLLYFISKHSRTHAINLH